MKLFSRPTIILLSLLFMQASFSMSLAYALDDAMGNNSQQGEVSASPTTEPTFNEPAKNDPYAEFNPNSIKPIPKPSILFQKRIWRQIYLKEMKNKPFFARDKEITKFIVEAVKEGILQPYTDETFKKEMSKEQFLENLKLPKEEGLSEQEKALGFTNEESGWGDPQATTPTSQETGKEKEAEYFFPHQITTLELVEDLIFNKVDATFVHDVQAITLILPEHLFPTGLRRIVGTFKYKDLAAYLDSKPKEALWINVKNSASNMKMTEAIELRLFDSRIIKIENPDNLTVEDIYNKTPQASLRASQQLEEELIELDWFLWEN